MDLETIFTDSKWRILTELSNRPLSPSDLSEKTGTSLPNISTQLKLLEALDFVEKEKLDNFEKGQARKIYSLKKEFAYLVVGTKTVMGKKMFKLNPELKFLFSCLLLNDSFATYVLIKLFLEHEILFKDSISFGYLGITENTYEILIIDNNISKFSEIKNKEIQRNEKTFPINFHVHKKDDFANGINNNDQYFKSLLKRVNILIDRDNFLSDIKKGAI